MHTFRFDRWKIHYNSDCSGDAIISSIDGKLEVQLPAELLILFTANFVRSQKMAKLEKMLPAQVLGIIA